MPLQVLQFLRIEINVGNLHVSLIITTTTSEICKSWSLHDPSSTRTQTGAYNTENRKDQPIGQVGTGRPETTFEFSDLGLLCSENNTQCCSCGLSSFRPTVVILTHSSKIKNTQLCFVFLNFSLVCQSNSSFFPAEE